MGFQPVKFIALDAKTGSSGGGAKPAKTTHHPHRMNNFSAYKQLAHQHFPEIRGGWVGAGGAADTEISFVPQRAPIVRGIFVTAHFYTEKGLSASQAEGLYREYYKDAPFVRIVDKSPFVADIWGTNMSIGVDSALNTILNALDSLRDTASAHNRGFLVETMGRQCGYLALMGGILGGAEMIIIPEVDVEREEVSAVIDEAYAMGKNHSLIVIAEGAKLRTTEIAKYLREHETAYEVRITILGHLQRGGQDHCGIG